MTKPKYPLLAALRAKNQRDASEAQAELNQERRWRHEVLIQNGDLRRENATLQSALTAKFLPALMAEYSHDAYHMLEERVMLAIGKVQGGKDIMVRVEAPASAFWACDPKSAVSKLIDFWRAGADRARWSRVPYWEMGAKVVDDRVEVLRLEIPPLTINHTFIRQAQPKDLDNGTRHFPSADDIGRFRT